MTGSSYRLIVEIAERYAKLAEKKAAARTAQVQVATIQKQPEPTQSFGEFSAEYGMWLK